MKTIMTGLGILFGLLFYAGQAAAAGSTSETIEAKLDIAKFCEFTNNQDADNQSKTLTGAGGAEDGQKNNIYKLSHKLKYKCNSTEFKFSYSKDDDVDVTDGSIKLGFTAWGVADKESTAADCKADKTPTAKEWNVEEALHADVQQSDEFDVCLKIDQDLMAGTYAAGFTVTIEGSDGT